MKKIIGFTFVIYLAGCFVQQDARLDAQQAKTRSKTSVGGHCPDSATGAAQKDCLPPQSHSPLPLTPNLDVTKFCWNGKEVNDLSTCPIEPKPIKFNIIGKQGGNGFANVWMSDENVLWRMRVELEASKKTETYELRRQEIGFPKTPQYHVLHSFPVYSQSENKYRNVVGTLIYKLDKKGQAVLIESRHNVKKGYPLFACVINSAKTHVETKVAPLDLILDCT